MELANYRSIPSVLTSKCLVDSSLSKTQRKTPTEIHKNYEISRIRHFYMRKVKFTQQTFHDKLTTIGESFPKIENVHPFYADLINVLYDKDHYKIALGKVNLSKGLIDKTSREYVRLLKYGDSLYRCKTLKRIALGRMVKIIKKLDKSLIYLEQVRQHLSRLPTIDPTTRTLILCGFPNVGKSSFLNSVSRAGVEVEPYPFTTKSLYVGQTDYKYLRFQVIDTPGILDKPLEDRNTIEMQAITALAHLRATIIYMMDASETCGYSIEQQAQLFDNLQPLFQKKTVLIGLNKTDVVPITDLTPQQKDLFERYEKDGFLVSPLSTLTGSGVMELRNLACDMILVEKENTFSNSSQMKNLNNRIHVAVPKSRDNLIRAPFIPPKLLEDWTQNAIKSKLLTQKYLKNMLEDDYKFDERELYLVDGEQKYDTIPEIFNGKNISDFIDRNIAEKLCELENLEHMRDEAGYYNIPKWSYIDIKAHMDRQNVDKMRQLTMDAHATKKSSKPPLTKAISKRVDKFNQQTDKRINDTDLPISDESSVDTAPESRDLKSYSDSYKNKLIKSGVCKQKLLKCKKMIQRSKIKNNLAARAGDADRRVYDLKPKHLFSGKRKSGKTQRR
ncbi:hypothetical protein HZS_6005 [Henneguya salminicola]|nr:hypothetical protein HZS_6005 [Henneguya salminicola]